MLDRNLDREASDKLAAERVLKARTELILARRFYGVLVSNVDPVLSRSVPRAATNGSKHFWNPDFVAKLSQDELLTVQVHESEHDARHHGTRRGDRDPEKWNIACDYAINIDLVDQGFRFPSADVLGGEPLIDPKYRGMSAEDIYRCRELDEQKAKKEQEEKERQEQNDDGQDEESEPGENADTDPGNGDQDSDDGDDDQDGDETGQDDGDEGQGEPEGEPEADDQGDGQGGAPDEAQDGQEGQGDGDGQGNPQDGTEGQGQGGGEPSDAEGDEQADGEPESVGDFAGSLGEVLDSAEDAGELSDDDTRWEKIVRQAASMAKGDAPGHVSREIERANNPPQDWREVLRAWIDGGTKRIETWNRPNRRFIGSGTILPGSQRDGINRLVACIDTSGSMDDVALACVETEVRAAFDEGVIDELIVVYGDTRVTRVDTYHAGDEIEFDPRGGGGTDLRPMFQYVAENVDQPSGMLIFSDMEIGDAGPEPECPCLWAATGYPDRVRAYLANTPWGAPGIDVGAH